MTSSSRSRTTARRAGVAILGVPVLALSLGACSGLGDPTAAAVVDGRTISERDVQIIASELADGTGGAVTPAQVVPLMVVAGVVDEITQNTVSRQGAQEALDAQAEAQQQPLQEYSDATLDFIATNLELSSIQQDQLAAAEFTERLEELDVRINPRYGSVDPEQGISQGIGAPSFPWLGQPDGAQPLG